jgi:hypothetical protein
MQRNLNSNTLRQLFHEKNRAILVVLATLGLMICCTSGFAQTQSGLSTIQGTVADSTGAVIRNATIHIVNKATGATSDAKSNDVGFYEAPGLIAGTYTVTVKAPNMKTYVYTVQIEATQTAVVNPVLTPGAVTEQVTVQGSIVQLTDTSSGAITSTLDRQQIDQLPMNTRIIGILVLETTPGLENGFGQPSGSNFGVGTRMNGLVGEAMEYVEDGAPTENRQFGGPNVSAQAQYTDPDAIQEVRVEASGGGAEYATPGTAVLTTKSGTNQMHGSAFWTGRNNSAAGIAKNRSNLSNFAAPNFKRNEFGASAGGPVILPHVYHGKDKTFWFFAYERYSLIQSSNLSGGIDTPAMAGGDFSGLNTTLLYDPATTTANAACPTPAAVSGVVIWNAGTPANNPYCRTPFGNGIEGDPGNNQIPVARRNAISKIMYDMEPTPNITGIINPTAASNYNWLAPNFYIVPTITTRLDHNFNEKNKAYVRFTDNIQTDQYSAGVIGTLAADGIPALTEGTETIAPYPNFVAAVGYTHVFSPSFFSETIISGNWAAQHVTNPGGQSDYESQFGLPNNFGEPRMPNIGSFVMSHTGNQGNYGVNQMILNIDENLTKTLDKHQLQFGVRYRHEHLGYQPDESTDQATTGGLGTALYNPATGANYGAISGTGANSADAFMGNMINYSVNILPAYTPFADQEFDAYIQDDFHMSKNLTVNLGLRWEDHPSMTSGGIGTTIDMVHHGLVLESTPASQVSRGITTQAIINSMMNVGANIETPAEAGMPSTLLRSYPFTFGPRVGFAWQMFGDRRGTVLSASYGRYIFPEALRNLIDSARNLPNFTGYGYNDNTAAQDPDSIANYSLRHPQHLFLGQNTSNIVNSAGNNAILPGIGGDYLNPDYPPEYVSEVNVTVEQPFKDQSALRVTYNYTHASNLDHSFYPNDGLQAFVWEYDTGTPTPTGGASSIGTCNYQTTGLNPWDCKVFGNFGIRNRNGWSVDNSLQVNYRRQFHHGIAYQAMYVWSRPFRVGGNSTRDSLAYPIQDYMGTLGTAAGASYAPAAGEGPMIQPVAPPPLPQGAVSWADYKALDRFEDYKTEPYYSDMYHHIVITGIYDLPVGRGKWLLGNSNRFVDEFVGGWQVAGAGQVLSQAFPPTATNWGAISPLVTYKHSLPIVDCSSGKCFNRFMWFNGYISPKFLPPGNGGVCTTNCVTGLPTSYVPYQVPINNNPNIAANFGNNNVNLTVPTLNGGNPISVGFAPDESQVYGGNNPYNKTVVHGPFNYEADLSVYKVFPINERMNVRVNVDAFNAFNIMGYNNPNATNGEESVSPGGVDGSSYWTPRQLQLTMRFTF